MLDFLLGNGDEATVPADGIYGPGTKSKVMEFQRRIGIGPDGKVGPQTFTALTVLNHAGENDGAFGVMLAALAHRESAFLPNAARPDGRRGLFLFSDKIADNVPIAINTRRQSDEEFKAAKDAILRIWNIGRARLSEVLRNIGQITGVDTKKSEGPHTKVPGGRLYALGFLLRPFEGCFNAIMGADSVKTTGWAFSAIEKLVVENLPSPPCRKAYELAIGTGTIDAIMATAARFQQSTGIGDSKSFVGPKNVAFAPAKQTKPAPLPKEPPAPAPSVVATPKPRPSTPTPIQPVPVVPTPAPTPIQPVPVVPIVSAPPPSGGRKLTAGETTAAGMGTVLLLGGALYLFAQKKG